MTKLTNLQDILNAQVKSEDDKDCFVGIKEYANAFELTDNYLENMSRKEIAQLLDNLLKDENVIDYYNNENVFIIEYKEVDIILYLNENIEYCDEISAYPKYIEYIQIYKKEKPLPVAILNTTILTADGDFSLKTISLEEAQELISDREILSAVGHESTAQVLTELLDVDVPLNRIQFVQKSGQKALCFKLNGRPQEVFILSKDDIEKMGYDFKILEMK